jgi:hypothetical protein
LEEGMELSELKLEDLVRQCEKCGGTGWLRENFSRGSGYGTNMVSREGPCPDCERGYIYTPAGKVLRDFLRIVRRGEP